MGEAMKSLVKDLPCSTHTMEIFHRAKRALSRWPLSVQLCHSLKAWPASPSLPPSFVSYRCMTRRHYEPRPYQHTPCPALGFPLPPLPCVRFLLPTAYPSQP